jgi:hypothetical protein
MTAGITTTRTLLQRDAEAAKEVENSARFYTFRRGPRPLNGEAGEEVLERVHELNGNYVHSFMWELIHNKTDNVFTPLMSFEMSTGHSRPGTTVHASLTDAHALALWDKMLSSLRVRPVVDAKPVAATPDAAEVPLGTWADASERCPQTGWWECLDGGDGIDIVGGRQQFYRKGESMAQATQMMPATPGQRLTGQRPTLTSKIPTSWKLVDRRQTARPIAPAAPMPLSSTPVDDVPSAAADQVDAQPDAMTAPGTSADNGMACPASGWWRCGDPLALDATRWFARGENLPMAMIPSRLSLLQKLAGASTVTPQPTTWQFIRHDEGRAGSPSNASDDDNAEKPA